MATIFIAGLCGCHEPNKGTAKGHSAPGTEVSDQAEAVTPLTVNDRAPNATLRRPDGEPVDMASLYKNKPSILVFYRGGWCPYCNTHLGQIAQAESELVAMGYQVLAISPDRPEALSETMAKGNYQYQLLSDSDMALSKAFGLAFRVDDPTIDKYRGFGIDLEKASGQSHHLLPVPAVYIVDTNGVIRFAHWNPDYKTRLQAGELIEAAKRIHGQ
jgi:peroxiredoxin